MRRLALLVLCSWGLAHAAAAQTSDVSLNARVLFYGDNTEFANPFAEGETTLGTFATIFLDIPVSETLTLRAGIFGNQHFGSHNALDQGRPVVAFVIGGPRSHLILGTLNTVRRLDGAGPDRIGPHDLLPPLQNETLAFNRPWEAGMQWTVDLPRVQQDAWINWQRVNSRNQREIFDVGLTNRLGLRRGLKLRTDLHVLHHGGQLSASSAGPVSDNFAIASGVEAGGAAGPFERVSLEMFAMLSHDIPDRQQKNVSRTGAGSFIRFAAEKKGWRVHGILWRADDFIAREGDPLYQAIQRDGTVFHAVRDYAEAGVTRTFKLASRSYLEMSARWHRVENDYGYSYRILAVTDLRRPLFH